MPLWKNLDKSQQEAVIRAINEAFDALEETLLAEGEAAAGTSAAELREVVDNILENMICEVEERADEIGFDPYDDEDEDDEPDHEPETVYSFIAEYYKRTLIPKRLPLHLLEQLGDGF